MVISVNNAYSDVSGVCFRHFMVLYYSTIFTELDI